MSTVDQNLADRIAAADGYYADDPRIVRIVKYTNAWGGDAYGLEYRQTLGKYSESEYVQNPTVYWRAAE